MFNVQRKATCISPWEDTYDDYKTYKEAQEEYERLRLQRFFDKNNKIVKTIYDVSEDL